MWLGNIDNLKWEGHVLEWTFCVTNLNVWLGVFFIQFLLGAMVLRFVYNKYGNVLSISGGFK